MMSACGIAILHGQEPLPTTAVAETPVVLSQSVFLDVKDMGTNVASSDNWHSVWGSYSKEMKKARGLEITVRNPAKLAGEYVVEWYFFAIPVRGGKRFLFDKDTKTVALPAGGMQKALVVSDEIDSTRIHYAYDYYYSASYKSGNKPEGWIVVVKAQGKILRLKTSGAQLDQIYKTEADLQTLGDAARKKRQSQ